MMSLHDQRGRPRVEKNLQVTLSKRVPGNADRLLKGNTLDVSQSGAFIKTEKWRLFELNELMELTIFFPTDFTGLDAPIGLQGCAVVRKVDRLREGIAVEFIDELRHFRPITIS
jgi:hypothetical protein